MSPAEPASLQAVLDRLAIEDVLAEFCERIDAGDLTGAVDLFTDDCVTDYGPGAQGELRGKKPFLERMRANQAHYSSTHHLLGQVRVTLNGDQASSVAYVHGGHRRVEDDSRYDARIQYHDEWTRTPAGWRIRARRVLFAIIDGGDASHDDRLWVKRKRPPV